MYLIVITKKKKVGSLFGHNVWKVVDFDVISYKKTILHLTDNQVMPVTILQPNSHLASQRLSALVPLPPVG